MPSDPGGDGHEVLGVKHFRCLQALPRSGRFVVDALAPPVGGGGVADGFPRRGEEVQAQ